MSFSILKIKSYKKNTIDSPKIELSDWVSIVESDNELIWQEDSKLAEEYKKLGKTLTVKKKHNAYFEINKKYGYGNIRFYFLNGNLIVDCERQTLKRVEKMWEVAQALEGYLFKNGTRFTEKKLVKLREKYNKTGSKAPSDNHDV